MKILIVSGSRADYGMLEWPLKLMHEDAFFEVMEKSVWNDSVDRVLRSIGLYLNEMRPDIMMILGDRFEIFAAATAAHLMRVPIAHIGGGDVTEGSYDDAMRDCISRMAAVHFATSTSAMARLTYMGYRNVHLVGSPGIDYIKHAAWKLERPIKESYVVVSYQAETIDGGQPRDAFDNFPTDKIRVWIRPNPDRGSKEINDLIDIFRFDTDIVYDFLPHGEFLNLIYHCDDFIGNSSAMLYEAPELGVKTRMVGKRQRGRTIPFGDGHASERIIHVLKYGAF